MPNLLVTTMLVCPATQHYSVPNLMFNKDNLNVLQKKLRQLKHIFLLPKYIIQPPWLFLSTINRPSTEEELTPSQDLYSLLSSGNTHYVL
jgi:hypothetical protein